MQYKSLPNNLCKPPVEIHITPGAWDATDPDYPPPSGPTQSILMLYVCLEPPLPEVSLTAFALEKNNLQKICKKVNTDKM